MGMVKNLSKGKNTKKIHVTHVHNCQVGSGDASLIELKPTFNKNRVVLGLLANSSTKLEWDIHHGNP